MLRRSASAAGKERGALLGAPLALYWPGMMLLLLIACLTTGDCL